MSLLSEGVRDVSQQYGRFCMIKVPVGVGRGGRGGESSLVWLGPWLKWMWKVGWAEGGQAEQFSISKKKNYIIIIILLNYFYDNVYNIL